MKKNYPNKIAKLLALALISSTSLLAQVNDENFDGLAPSLRGLDYTTNGIRFQQISPTSISQMASLSEPSDFIITPIPSDLGMLFNIDNSGTVNGPNIGAFDYRIGSADGSEFKIESMEADMSAKNPANGYAFTATITGYRDGAVVATDNIDFTVSDTNGSVSYTKDANPAANGGVLTFNSDWGTIDEIRFTGGNSSSISLLMVDELDFSMPDALSIEKNSIQANFSLYPNPTKGTVNLKLGNAKDTKIKVINTLGQVVYKKDNINNSTFKFELNQPAGIYLIQIESKGKSKTLKLIKE
ncbi:T9SS type A sorting domain-containing protein [Mesoflavibacter sp.]|uniref:T9SS type A sorting domain-containing protein n=1 Tax=Mesoflavibacter sp. TaxID=1930902 RepID=UPI00351338DD